MKNEKQITELNTKQTTPIPDLTAKEEFLDQLTAVVDKLNKLLADSPRMNDENK